MIHTTETTYASVVERLTVQGVLPIGKSAELALIPANRGGWAHQPTTAPTAVDLGQPLQARVNHSRWLVDCPDCHSAQVASRSDQRFFCTDCQNAYVGGTWRRVAWPKNADAIEEALLVRPLEHQRNWQPDETVADLVAENVAHGIKEG